MWRPRDGYAAARHGHAVRTCALHGISIDMIQHREIAPPIVTKEFAMRKKPLVISGSFNPAMLILSSVLLSISIKLSRVSLETLLYGEYKDKCI